MPEVYITCPYCNKEVISAVNLDENVVYTERCLHCEKEFTFVCEISVQTIAHKIEEA